MKICFQNAPMLSNDHPPGCRTVRQNPVPVPRIKAIANVHHQEMRTMTRITKRNLDKLPLKRIRAKEKLEMIITVTTTSHPIHPPDQVQGEHLIGVTIVTQRMSISLLRLAHLPPNLDLLNQPLGLQDLKELRRSPKYQEMSMGISTPLTSSGKYVRRRTGATLLGKNRLGHDGKSGKSLPRLPKQRHQHPQ